jgi:hypothetical protein
MFFFVWTSRSASFAHAMPSSAAAISPVAWQVWQSVSEETGVTTSRAARAWAPSLLITVTRRSG